MKTLAGRSIDPPKQKKCKRVKTNLHIVDNWLLQEAIQEALHNEDDFNLCQFSRIDFKKMTVAERDGLNLYLFGELEVPLCDVVTATKTKRP
jgi:hypothetical protein